MKMHASMILAVGLLIAADAPKENAAKKEMAKLQGTWQMIALEVFGQGRAFKGPKEEVELEKVIIKGDNWTLRRAKVIDKNGIERKETEEKARYQLDATKEPKTIDLVWTDGDNKGKTYPGVFTLEGDTLKICYAREGKERPTGFTAEATKQIKDHCVLMILKRERPGIKELQGKWRAVEQQTAGISAPKEVLEKARMEVKDDEMTWYSGGTIVRKSRIRLDPSKSPKAVDITILDGPSKGLTFPGIYVLEKGQLRVCYSHTKDSKDRPNDFKTERGELRELLILEREKPRNIDPTAAGDSKEAAVEKDIERPQGVWTAVAMEELGNKFPRRMSGKRSLV